MNDEILIIVKRLLKITDDTQDDNLRFHVDLATQDALNYLNRNKLPDALKYTVAQIVRLSVNSALNETDLSTAIVSSVSEAGRSVSFATAQMTEQAIEAEQKEIYAQLNRLKLPFMQEVQ